MNSSLKSTKSYRIQLIKRKAKKDSIERKESHVEIFFFSCKHKVYILKDFKSCIEKIKYYSSIYIVNFLKELIIN
jgi:hypothetical protein